MARKLYNRQKEQVPRLRGYKRNSLEQWVEANEFKSYLSQKGFKVRTAFTTSLEHARQLASDAAVDYDCAMVVAVGGDGVIREIAHGLEGSDKPLLIVPAGTENLLANELGFDGRLQTTIKTFEAGHVKPLDLGCVNGTDSTRLSGL